MKLDSTQHNFRRLRSVALTILVNVCRFLLGATFVFSGFVKAVDPIGTQYKIQDYLGAVSLEGVLPDWVTLTTSVLLSALEFSLGVFILLAMRRRLVSKIIVAFMAVMTLITLWLALFNPVKDCGCFGDAIHLTNFQTLIKNIVLLAASLVGLAAAPYDPVPLALHTVDSSQLHHPFRATAERPLSLPPATHRLPSLPHWYEHQEGHGDTEGCTAASV